MSLFSISGQISSYTYEKLTTRFGGLAVWNTLLAQPARIGTTTCDMQTNDTNKIRLLVYYDGKASALWTASTSMAVTFRDRSMYFNSRKAGSWSSFPGAPVAGRR